MVQSVDREVSLRGIAVTQGEVIGTEGTSRRDRICRPQVRQRRVRAQGGDNGVLRWIRDGKFLATPPNQKGGSMFPTLGSGQEL